MAASMSMSNKKSKNSTSIWSGVSPLEIEIIKCCEDEPAIQSCEEPPQQHTGETGEIGEGKEGEFAVLLARYCHSAADRALALAVLHRTVLGDEFRRSSSKSSDSGGLKIKESSSRMINFLSAGGLRILNIWLVESSTPVEVVPEEEELQQQTPKRGGPVKKKRMTTSPTGAILIALLDVLELIPFHRRLITQTAINKQIRKLRKSLDKIIALIHKTYRSNNSSPDEDGFNIYAENVTHPVAGGLPVVKVHKAVNHVVSSWRKKDVNDANKSDIDYFSSLRSLMESRYAALQEYENGGDKPDWLERIELLNTQKPRKRKNSFECRSDKERIQAKRKAKQLQEERVKKKYQAELKKEKIRKKLKTIDHTNRIKSADLASNEILHKTAHWKDRVTLPSEDIPASNEKSPTIYCNVEDPHTTPTNRSARSNRASAESKSRPAVEGRTFHLNSNNIGRGVASSPPVPNNGVQGSDSEYEFDSEDELFPE